MVGVYLKVVLLQGLQVTPQGLGRGWPLPPGPPDEVVHCPLLCFYGQLGPGMVIGQIGLRFGQIGWSGVVTLAHP